MQRKTPKSLSIEQEANFWDTHSVADYALNPVTAEEVIAELRQQHQPKKNVTFRLETSLLKRLKQRAKQAGVRYQAFVREWLWRAAI